MLEALPLHVCRPRRVLTRETAALPANLTTTVGDSSLEDGWTMTRFREDP